MLALCIERLCGAGYVYIGMDHFAKPDDDLAVAQRENRMQRNFQGYSTHAETDLVSCGVSGISAVDGTYSQNEKRLEDYYRRIDAGELPVARGLALAADDFLRRRVIQLLACDFELSMPAVEAEYAIVFADYFAGELKQLADDAARRLAAHDE